VSCYLLFGEEMIMKFYTSFCMLIGIFLIGLLQSYCNAGWNVFRWGTFGDKYKSSSIKAMYISNILYTVLWMLCRWTFVVLSWKSFIQLTDLCSLIICGLFFAVSNIIIIGLLKIFLDYWSSSTLRWFMLFMLASYH